MKSSVYDYLLFHLASSKQIQAATGLGQSAVSRQIRALGDRIVRLGNGKNTRYALTRHAFDYGDNLPLYAIDPHGNAITVANIRPLTNGGYLVEKTMATPAILLGHNGDGLFDDLPFFLDDLRPQGFLGRQIARNLSDIVPFPVDPRDWSAEQIGSYLIANGDDLPGNFKLGRHSLMRNKNTQISSVEDYPGMAKSVLGGTVVGSSAGGEQPKFTAYTEQKGHVIVKFSPPGDDTVARCWRDILLTEYYAQSVLTENHSQGFSAVDCDIHEVKGRLFLESSRFDRHADTGRLPAISLQAIDAEFVGDGSQWVNVMSGLQKQGLVTGEHVFDTEVLHYFGLFINNTDMHLGNLSLAFEGSILKLLPVYDMCSMGLAPKAGEVNEYEFSRKMTQQQRNYAPAKLAFDMAVRFWELLAQDNRISPEMKTFVGQGNPVSR